MKIVIDSNRIIAALIKNSLSREIIFNENFEFIAPDYTLTEIRNHQEEIIRKAKISSEEFELLLSLIFEDIEIIPKSEYEEFLEEAENLIEDIDDVPFLAVAIAKKAEAIWTEDPDFFQQNKIKILKTKEMKELL